MADKLRGGTTIGGFIALHYGNLSNVIASIQEQLTNGNPSGAVITFAGSTAPSGYLKCNGAAVSRATYAELYAVVGDTYGNGDGSTTFNLPELRGEFVRGWDDSRGVDSGRSLGTSQSANNASHTHTGPSHTHTGPSHTHTLNHNHGASGSHRHSYVDSLNHNDNIGGWSLAGDAARNDTLYTSYTTVDLDDYSGSTGSGGTGNTGSGGTGNTGSSGSEARPRNIAMLYCIKF